MKIITSLDNVLVKKALNFKDPRNRDDNNRCLVEGQRAVATFLSSPYQLVRLYCTVATHQWAQQHVDEKRIVVLDERCMQKISSATTASGIVGMFDIPAALALDTLSDGIVLAQIQDPGNMGTLIRTAAALNKQIVIVEGVNPYNQKVIQASAGTLAHAHIFRVSWEDFLQHKGQATVAALVVENGEPLTRLAHGEKKKKRFLVVGNEAHGLPAQWQQQCDECITLPMPGGTESLNAAVAGSIALYMLYQEQ